ncbi:glycosyltransferase family 4 protein [Acidihalobacter prosperus]|uniref:Glycosyl transferase n=1 Tax=Acidihalobacter prosperus TaxID=160660 RepID=A0A1A6C7L8_9GAMM|nr:glycosyltransferase family 4 protein [Acidihalobacter prosperus]OBS10545.1 glycosyl transferase [Acidihalobacter prosperus]
MFPSADKPIGYILKRYPRLSETFILNEIRALERLGTRLTLFSLLRPEETHFHPTVNEVRSPVHYLPASWLRKAAVVAGAHLSAAAAAPLRYLHALGLASWWAIRTRHPISVGKQFLRAGFVAHHSRRAGIQHLHAHFANAPATVARLAAVMCGITYSFTTHAKDLYLSPARVISRRVRSASFVLTCTQHNVDYLRGFLPPEDHAKVHLVYHGIDLSAFPPVAPSASQGERPLILSVGRLVPKKGMSDLIEACRLLRDRGVPFRCAIVGQGPLRDDLERRVGELQLGSEVEFLGAMAHDRLIRLYGEAAMFALACHVTEDGDRDGIPNVIVEAMATGLPVVSTQVSGIPELVDHGRNGILVSPRDSIAMADALQRLLEQPALRNRIGQAARNSIEGRFECWETAKEVRSLLLAEATT